MSLTAERVAEYVGEIASALAVATDDLAQVGGEFADRAGERGLAVLPDIPSSQHGPVVELTPGAVSAQAFADLAADAGRRILYLVVSRIEPGDVLALAGLTDDEDADGAGSGVPAARRAAGAIGELRRQAERVSGWTSHVEAAFACDGVLHLWSAEAPWHAEAHSLAAQGEEEGETLAEERREAVTEQVVQTLLALKPFRAARGSTRNRVARAYLAGHPIAGAEEHVVSYAISQAAEQAETKQVELYLDAENRVLELAELVAADVGYRAATSDAARKRRITEILAPKHEDYLPPIALLELVLDKAAALRAKPAPGLF